MTLRHRYVRRVVAVVAMLCLFPNISFGYSVLAHEAIIDTLWDSDITPVLLKRFPNANVDDLRKAHAYAYGGAIIQDLGYYPFGSKFYSSLTHYVRAGEFVQTMLAESHDLNEFAFALGALSHYWADVQGHHATNTSVALLYPDLRARYGDYINYSQKHSAHIQTEFGFDVVQVARGHYASQAYHDFIGFKVSRDLLARSFRMTYGIELSSLFLNLDLAFSTYRLSVSDVIPRMTRVAWDTHKKSIASIDTAPNSSAAFEYKISRTDSENEWSRKYGKPGPLSKVLSAILKVIPKVGPLKGFAIRNQTAETQKLFVEAYENVIHSYRDALTSLSADTLHLANLNLDIGKPTRRGEYSLTDRAYAKLVDEVAESKYKYLGVALRSDILAFYSDSAGSPVNHRLDLALIRLRDTRVALAADSGQ